MSIRFIVSSLLIFLALTAPRAQNHADCSSAMEICEKKVYHIDKAGGEGADNREADFMHCFLNGENKGQAEENSTWIKFEIAESGNLSFAITPHRITDDIDFVVYRFGASGACDSKTVVRCMAAGDSPDFALSSNCMGETGLKSGEKDSSADAGCNDPFDNAWLAPIKAVKGEKYIILVSNVTSRGPGFSIRFTGSAKLPCDKEKKPEQKPAPTVKKPQAKVKSEQNETKIAAKAPPPVEIGGRKVEVGKEVSVKNRILKIKLWDSQVEDGDIISIYLNDRKVISNVYLRLKPQEFEIQLPEGGEHYITVYSEDFGKAEPNSAKVSIFDGKQEQTIDLVAGRSKQESVKIVVE